MSQSEKPSPSSSSWQVYKRLLQYVKPHWFAFVVAFIGFALYAVSQTGFAKWLEYVVDTVSEGNFDDRGILALAVIALFLVRGIGSFLGSYALAYTARHVISQLRFDLFDRLLVLPKSFFDSQPSGQLLSRLTYNVEQVTGAATDAVRVILREGLTVMGLFGYLLYLNWKLTLIFVAVIPFIGFAVSYAAKRLRKISNAIQRSVGDVAHVSAEVINGIEVVRAYSGQKTERERFKAANEQNRQQFMKLVVTQAINTPVVQLIVAVALALLMYMAMHPSLMAQMTAGEFIAFITAAGMIAKPMRQITEVASFIQQGVAASESVFEVTDLEGERDFGHLASVESGDICFKQVSFTYPKSDKPVIADLSLTIKAGESVALVGRSGSGKSTLAGLIPRFYDVTEGEVTLAGAPLQDYQLSGLRRQIALVSQSVFLFDGSIAQNIAYGDLATKSREEVEAAAKAAHVTEFTQHMPDGLDTHIGEQGVMLSGGQRQRIALARALLKDAPVLILDEATSALDTQSERYVQAAIERVMQGRTTLVIAHRLSTIENVDRILVMDQGRVIESGDHATLLAANGAYANLHKMQSSQS